MSRSIVVLFGSVRLERQGLPAALFIKRKIEDRGHRSTLIDPMVDRLPLLERRLKDYAPGTASPVLTRLSATLAGADGYVLVSAEYNASIPPALSNLMDHFIGEYARRPAAIVCYSAGAFGGVRAAVQLRSFLAELGMVAVPAQLAIPKIQDQFDPEGVPKDPAWDGRAQKFLDEFLWYVDAIAEARVPRASS